MKKWIAILAIVTVFGCKDKEAKSNVVIETKAKIVDKVSTSEILFDGSTFDNWTEYLKEGVSEHWKIEDGAMVFYPPANRAEGESFNLVTKKSYTNFELSLEWKISEAGNSGIFWGVKEDASLPEAYQTGPEIQILDNEKHPDAKAGTTHQAGALYDMVSPAKDVTKAVGEWNTCVISINHKSNAGSVMLNGVKMVDFKVNNPDWSTMVAKSKFAEWEHFGKYPTGKIGLQDHGDQVAFRNIKIKEL